MSAYVPSTPDGVFAMRPIAVAERWDGEDAGGADALRDDRHGDAHREWPAAGRADTDRLLSRSHLYGME